MTYVKCPYYDMVLLHVEIHYCDFVFPDDVVHRHINTLLACLL